MIDNIKNIDVNKKCIISSNIHTNDNILYPPNNTIAINIHIKIILAYSAKKKKTNIPAACSVIKPLTNSDSASAKSKGALLVSAIDAIKNIPNKGNIGTANQIIFCISIITLKFKVPVAITINNNAELKINS
jgi:hypothetical protein